MKENAQGIGEKGNVMTSSRFLKSKGIWVSFFYFIATGDESWALSIGPNNLVVTVDMFLEESWDRKTTPHYPELNYLSSFLAIFSSYIFLMWIFLYDW